MATGAGYDLNWGDIYKPFTDGTFASAGPTQQKQMMNTYQGFNPMGEFQGNQNSFFKPESAAPGLPDTLPGTGYDPSSLISNNVQQKDPFNFGTLEGWGAGINSAANLFGAWNGYQNVKLGRNQLDFQKESFNKQYDYQKELTEERRNRHNSIRAKWG